MNWVNWVGRTLNALPCRPAVHGLSARTFTRPLKGQEYNGWLDIGWIWSQPQFEQTCGCHVFFISNDGGKNPCNGWGFNDEIATCLSVGHEQSILRTYYQTKLGADHMDTMLRQCLQTRTGQIEINLGEKRDHNVYIFFLNNLC